MIKLLAPQDTVVLQRVMRDGSVKEERLECWLAELTIGCISYDEPEVAHANIRPLPVDDYRKRSYPRKVFSKQQLYRLALALAHFKNPLDAKSS